MSTATPFPDLIRSARDRAGVGRLLAHLGFDPPAGSDAGDELPTGAWSAYGLADAPDVRALVLAGRSGSLDALLVESAPGTGTDRVAWLARRVRQRNPARLHLFVAARLGQRRTRGFSCGRGRFPLMPCEEAT